MSQCFMTPTRLNQQLAFLKEIDKVKQIFRQTRLFDNTRYENDAEHAWHLGLMALVLAEHAATPVDVAKVVTMVLLHDLVEIDAGDTFLYDPKRGVGPSEAEAKAARRIFGLLPEEQAHPLLALWEEFEARQSPEAKFAASLDRLAPLLQNHATAGHAWKAHGVHAGMVRSKNAHIAEGSPALWELAQNIIDDSVKQGFLAPDPTAVT